MSDLKIAIVYFSGTDVTQAYAEAIRNALLERNCSAQLFDVTAYAARQAPLPIDDFDGFVFGFPVYSDFAPSVINAWLATLDGRGKRCAQFFTYGGRATGYAHFHTRLLLEQAGFQVVCSAEFVGRHSYNVSGWGILPDRPDAADFAVARAYADLAIERFSQDTPAAFSLAQPAGYEGAMAAPRGPANRAERRWNNPVRVTETCSMCRDCENECPTRSFDADTGLSDPVNCISCMHCVYICPDRVIKADQGTPDAHDRVLARWHLTEELINARESKIVT